MQKTKAKHDSFWRRQMLPFVVVWVINVGIVNIISRIWPWQIFSLGSDVKVILTLFSTVVLSGTFQVFLVERLLKRSMRGWMLYTAASVLLTLILDALFNTDFWRSISRDLYFLMGYPVFSLFSSLALNVPTSLLQALWLRQRVHRAWLWPLLTIPLLMVFSMMPFGGENYGILKGVLMLSVGVVQAGLMHYLWQHPKETSHIRLDVVADEDHEAQRLERLQEHDQQTPLWDQGHEGLQYDAQ